MIDEASIPGDTRAPARRLAFGEVAVAFNAIARSLDASEKTVLAAELLEGIAREADVVVAARWLAGDRRFTPHPTVASTLAARVYAVLSGEAIDEVGSLDHEIFLACRSMAGSSMEAIRMLLEARARVGTPVGASEELTLEQIVDALAALQRAQGTDAKLELLVDLWRAMDPIEIATLHLLLGRAAVVAGMSDELVAAAIARAFGRPVPLVRHALAIDGDAGATALAARRGTLDATFARPLQLIAPMHATALERRVDDDGAIRLEGIDDVDVRELLVEERLPGARAQLHVWPADDDDGPTRVAMFSLTGRDLLETLPSLASRLAAMPSGTVIDGQLIVGDDPLFVGFDLLVEDGRSLLEAELDVRRARLESLAEATDLPITRVVSVGDRDELERLYVETIARGGLGIVAKHRTSRYEFGRRSRAWLKAPGEPETVLAVIRYASVSPEGSAGASEELTFGVWLGEGDGARLVNIGRAAVALEADELEALDLRLRRLRGKRFGTNYEIEPRIVCELEYDAIRVSPRTDAGYTIRVARIRCVRWELGAAAAATVAAIEERHRRLQRSRSLESAIVRR